MNTKIYYINEHGLGVLKGTLERLKVAEKETEDKETIATHVLYSFVCGQNRQRAGRAMTSGDYIEFEDGEIWVCCMRGHKATEKSPAHKAANWTVLK